MMQQRSDGRTDRTFTDRGVAPGAGLLDVV